MGLAASQARFLGITLRKANCEFKSTALAQDRLELTEQMTQISSDYFNAINSTQLIWSNPLCETDMGVSYALLMTPSAANDFNPYMITTKRGAVVLNSGYAAAASAAGIPMGGCIASEEGYKNFIKALGGELATGKNERGEDVFTQIITVDTKNTILGLDNYHYASGLGAYPMDKSVMGSMTLDELILNDSIGGQTLDWMQIFRNVVGYGYDDVSTEVGSSRNSGSAAGYNFVWNPSMNTGVSWGVGTSYDAATNTYSIGFDSIFHVHGNRNIAGGEKWDGNKSGIGGVYDVNYTNTEGGTTRFTIQRDGSANGGGDIPVDPNSGKKRWLMPTLTMVTNGSIEMDSSTIKNMTLGDLLTQNIVIMAEVDSNYTEGEWNNTQDPSKNSAIVAVQWAGEAMLDDIARIFGYNSSGVGLNVDPTTYEALSKAYEMTKKKFLSLSDLAKTNNGFDDVNMADNGAYKMSQEYNRIGVAQSNNDTYAALNLSAMVSTFLTYYDNYLRGAESDYYVNKSMADDRTLYVTDDPNYVYVTAAGNKAVTNDDKINDFYNQLYNNLCEHGWRYDDHIEDYEYLESAIKDGRYSLMTLNPDGYFYQAKYNDLDYMVEETDRNAIAKAEADFTRKKAELTAKEDRIDIKTKKLDAEIAELTTELNSVQQIISKSIEKTFSLFSN